MSLWQRLHSKKQVLNAQYYVVRWVAGSISIFSSDVDIDKAPWFRMRSCGEALKSHSSTLQPSDNTGEAWEGPERIGE